MKFDEAGRLPGGGSRGRKMERWDDVAAQFERDRRPTRKEHPWIRLRQKLHGHFAVSDLGFGDRSPTDNGFVCPHFGGGQSRPLLFLVSVHTNLIAADHGPAVAKHGEVFFGSFRFGYEVEVEFVLFGAIAIIRLHPHEGNGEAVQNPVYIAVSIRPFGGIDWVGLQENLKHEGRFEKWSFQEIND